MIQGHVRYQGSGRIDGVGRVKASPHANFENPDIEIGAGEQKQRGQGSIFEIGQRNIAADSLNLLERGDNFGVIGKAPPQRNPFVIGDDVR
jgi:hypothetical protein